MLEEAKQNQNEFKSDFKEKKGRQIDRAKKSTVEHWNALQSKKKYYKIFDDCFQFQSLKLKQFTGKEWNYWHLNKCFKDYQ